MKLVRSFHKNTELLGLSPEELRLSRRRPAPECAVKLALRARPHGPISSTDADTPLRGDIVGKHSFELHAGAFSSCRENCGKHSGIAKKVLVEPVEPDAREIGSFTADFY